MNESSQKDNMPFDINALLNLSSNATSPLQPPAQVSTLDQITNSENMHIIKAAIPFLNYNMQKQLAIMVKFLELKNTFNIYNTSENFQKVEQLNLHKNSKEEMLQNIRYVCSEGNKNLVDILLNVLNINKLYKNFQAFQAQKQESEKQSTKQVDEPAINDTIPMDTPADQQNQSSSNDTMLEGLKSMLTPDQRNMFDMLSTMMQTMNPPKKESNVNE